jgi:hypothetical protein
MTGGGQPRNLLLKQVIIRNAYAIVRIGMITEYRERELDYG